MHNIQSDLQRITTYLAHRTCEEKHLTNVDMIVVAGNAMPTIAEYASSLYKRKIAPCILISGGIGHSTNLLYNHMERLGYGKRNAWKKKSEAQCFAYVLEANGVDTKDIILETKSTNTGENASYTKKTLMQIKKSITTMVLLQDPILQLRTFATFQKVFPSVYIYSYAMFRPIVQRDGTPVMEGMDDIWDKQRFLSLLLGELHRVYDDENGYGPKGKNYTLHVDMPKAIFDAWQRVEHYVQDKIRDKR